MHFPRRAFSVLFSLSLSLSLSLAAEQPPPRDLQAILLVQQLVGTMGGVLPQDSLATGTVTLMEGSTTEMGAIRILTRGFDQNREEIQTPESRRVVVHSRERAKEQKGGVVNGFSLELAISSRPGRSEERRVGKECRL